MHRKLFALLPVVLFAGSTPLFATPVVFFGQDINTSSGNNTNSLTNSNAAHNAFFNNLTGTQTQTFETYATGTALPLTISFGSTGNATLMDPSNSSRIRGASGAGRFATSGTKYLETGAGSGFTLTFSSPVSAFGFYGTDVGDFNDALSLALGGANPTTLLVPATAGAKSGSALYFGFYDTQNTYNSITFNNTGGTVDIFGFDDFTIGSLAQVTPTVTPEPTSLLLLGTGVTAMWGARRKLRRG